MTDAIQNREEEQEGDDLREEYRFDYRKSRPNRFADKAAAVLTPVIPSVSEGSERGERTEDAG